jgi:casein kinase 1
VRNLGFEDTPDYDYLRELFTQALKSTGEVEDGEYDWMKINNGKGWEVMKAHPSAVHHLQNANANQNSSTAVNVHGHQVRQQKTPLPVDHRRLNEPLPKPGAAHGARQSPRDAQHGRYTAEAAKRKSMGELAPPEGSTQAQFPHSQTNLAQQSRAPQVQSPNAAQPRRAEPEKPSVMKKIMNIICCGGGSS